MSAVAEIPVVVNPPASPSWTQRMSSLDKGQRLRLGAVAVLVVVGLVAAVMFNRQPDYKVLFSNLSDKDGGAIVAQLTTLNVPYQYSEGGGAILIPADRVHDVRLKLATQGLPKGSVTGFELMETSRFGITQFQERLNFQRGLEGELTRSIQALASVQNARVHLALPNQNGFFREQQKPSASVLVTLHPGRFLDRAQIAGIVHLVASSVPELQPAAVSILDDTGKLLSQSPDGNGNQVDVQKLMYTQQIEQQYTRRILDILEPVVGKDNVRAQVTADMDFSQTESTSEQHRPNQGPDSSAVRSQQVVESSGSQQPAQPTGVPGATSNQPPVAAAAPVNGANPAPAAANGQGAATGAKRESLTNYEVDKTVRVTRSSSGAIKRLTAAVVVNYQPVTTEAGQAPVQQALSAEQQAKMLALVRETIGFSQERGDSVNLMNAQFRDDSVPVVELPLWKQPEVIELARTLAWPLGLALFGAILILGLLRPLLKSRAVEAKGSQLDALEADDPDRPPLLGGPVAELTPTESQVRLEQARQLTKQNPIAVANIVKTWVNGES
ncbi:flagellar basal-body MS-ring/collar protein FliF [Acidovorax sp. CCYZU-2555]|uniref:flagellar basal-body MS-ring/collar protein FliF n=1 Tax=Acidovorax sp. CCYZU-2555 TaxID=2835042 RepID=UPI001BCF30CF|nr:flagellar basal-body MS-ring/collar protein FliF [Acidovorax sp. CCYZU-2555]MBS7781182.1 flagellar M-ring protein FliF [Acidovorax sp. CCYZU-2555]